MARNKRKTELMMLNKERLMDMAFGRWQITCPETIDPDIIEPILTMHGKGAFAEVPGMGWVFGQMVPQGMLDANGNPEKVDIILKNGKTITGLDFSEVIPVYNNKRRTGIIYQLTDFAWRLATLQLTIDTNVSLRKMPGLVSCNQKEQAAVKNLLNAWAGDEFLVFGRKDFNIQDLFSYVDFGVPDVATPTDMLRNRCMQEALAYLGIDSSPSEKGAQVGMAEVVSNMGKAYAMRLSYQQPRDRAEKLAAERGITIHWEWQGLEAAKALLENVEGEEEEPNELVHNETE